MTSSKVVILGFLHALALPAAAQSVVPPQVIEDPPAVYPVDRHEQASVTVVVTVDPAGNVVQPEIAIGSGAPEFDAAALEAVRKWKFRPALRDGVPFAARIRIPFIFQPPAALPAIPDAGAPPAEASPPKVVPLGPTPIGLQAVGAPTADGGYEEVSVRGHERAAERGGSDFQIEVGKLSVALPSKSASDALLLAPGIFIANEAGEGHADQVFLRGFNAEQGQQIEFTVNGVPINEVDNTDGHGYSDTHFIIPELVKNLRVLEGPFDPHQGDFAVAGSAEYELGLPTRGITLEGWTGSFGSNRLLALWGPKDEREGTFAGAQFWTSEGYGENRSNSNASVMAEYEGELGQRGLYRILLTSYATHFKSAGVIRKDDYLAGRIDYFGTADYSQGGDAQRHSISFDLENPTSDGVLKQQLFLTLRNLRLLENFTGFLLDPQEQGQSIHSQRGDGILQDYQALTAGAKGSFRWRKPIAGAEQSIEVGYYARFDHTIPEIQRVRFGTEIPYRIDQSMTTDVFNLAGYIDLDLHLFPWLVLRGGVREEFFDYDVLDRCATNGIYARTQPLNVNCPSYDLSGPREPTERRTATGAALEPRGTAIVRLSPEISLTGSFGLGAQSIDARYIAQEENAPLSELRAGEAGVLLRRQWKGADISGRAVGYWTHVDRDLLFDPQLGRLTQASGTTRAGVVAAARATGRWFDEMASFTYVHASFDADGALVPYVPITILRSDSAVFGPLFGLRLFDRRLIGTAGVGVNFIGPRSLPFSQMADPTLEVDASASLGVFPVKVGLRVSNLTDARYPLSQFFYASDFHSRDYPTLVPTAHFTAAPPRTFLLTLSVLLDPEGGR